MDLLFIVLGDFCLLSHKAKSLPGPSSSLPLVPGLENTRGELTNSTFVGGDMISLRLWRPERPVVSVCAKCVWNWTRHAIHSSLT